MSTAAANAPSSNIIVPPVVTKPIVKGHECFQVLGPLAGVTNQDATPFVGPWQRVRPGAALQLRLAITALTGTLLVHLETVADVKQPPRMLDAFEATNAIGTADLLAVSDAFVRVVATPGADAGQTASWTVSGKGFVPFAQPL